MVFISLLENSYVPLEVFSFSKFSMGLICVSDAYRPSDMKECRNSFIDLREFWKSQQSWNMCIGNQLKSTEISVHRSCSLHLHFVKDLAILHQSLSTIGSLPSSFNYLVILVKASLHPTFSFSYYTVSLLSFIAKVCERIVGTYCIHFLISQYL